MPDTPKFMPEIFGACEEKPERLVLQEPGQSHEVRLWASSGGLRDIPDLLRDLACRLRFPPPVAEIWSQLDMDGF